MLNDQEQERFMRLWTECQPAVVNYIHARVRDPAAAKDLAQETALVLFRRFSEYDGQRPFLALALGVAQCQVRGFRRDAARSLRRTPVPCGEDRAPVRSTEMGVLREVAPGTSPDADGLAGRSRTAAQSHWFVSRHGSA